MWSIYLLHNRVTNRTYVGATTEPARRLRQHNREITGGSRSTKDGAPHWYLVSVVGGFIGRAQAYRWEAIVKKRARGLDARSAAMFMVGVGKCPPAKTRRQRNYLPPMGLMYSVYEYSGNTEL